MTDTLYEQFTVGVGQKPTRRDAIGSIGAALGLTTLPAAIRPRRPAGLVSVTGMRFELGGGPYRYMGTNMWYGAYLGADTDYGNRDRLRRELDRLGELGVDNVRVMCGSEASPLKGAVTPTFRDRSTRFNKPLLGGLDYLLVELRRRDMRAVMCINNFWEWSGGMQAYLYWANGGHYVDENDPAAPWPAYSDFTAQFYANTRAVAMADDYVRAIVGRINSITGARYVEDPAIMAWQLANEPRPGETAAKGYLPAYAAWIRSTARLIKSIDPHHLVSTGGEGVIGCLGSEGCLTLATPPEIDYMSIHIWPKNFGWINVKDLAGSRAAGQAKSRSYIDQHIKLATKLGRPLVLEEFGYPRDGGSYDPAATTIERDAYYRFAMDAVVEDAMRGGPLAAVSFWAWNGEGRAQHSDYVFHAGDTNWLGDPSHEPQGYYGVFDTDRSTQAVIREYATALRRIG